MVRGGGGWLTANQWWNGSANVNWTSGDDAIFGNGGAGGAVTLASGTTVNSLTFNSFTGTYTLGTVGQTITLNSGITMNSGAGAATIISPITLGGAQSWLNNSSSLLTIGTGAVTNGGFLLTIGGTGNTTVSSAIGGSGGLTKSGAGLLTLSVANTYTGTTTVSGGVVRLSNATSLPGGINATGGTSALTLNGGVVELANGNFLRNFGAGVDQFQITGGESGFSAFGVARVVTVNNTAATEVQWGSASFAPTTFVLNAATANSAITFSNNLDLNAATRTVAVNANTATMSGLIRTTSGTAGLTKTGNGTLILSNAGNTFNGQLTVSAGNLSIASINNDSANGTLGNSALAVILGSTGNTGTLSYTGSNASSTKKFTMASGGTGAFDVTTSATSLTLSGLIDGSGGLTKVGAGTLILSNASNSYTGPTTLTAGTLSVGAAANLGNAASNLVFNGGTLQITGTGLTNFASLGRTNPVTFNSGVTVVLDINNAANVFTPDQTFNQGTGGLSKAGAGTLVINSAHTYTGRTTISAGTLQVGDGGATGSLSAAPLLNSGTLVVNRTGTLTQGTAFPSVIGGTGSVNHTGSGTLVLNAPNYYTGTTTATAGTLQLSNALALQNSALVTTGAGTVTLSGVITPTFGGLSGASGDLATVISSGYGSVTNLTLNPQSGSVTYGGVIANGASDMALTKTGAGTQTLTNTNTYSGATNVNAGTLTLSGNGSINSSSGIVIQGGTLSSTSTTTATTPFGAQSLNFKHGTLSLVPASAGAYAFTGANAAAGSTFTYSGGTNLVLTRTGANTLSYTIGNAGANADTVLVRSGNGTLVIAPTSLANMGGSAAGSENFIINQQTTASNKNGASSAAGIFDASVVGQASNVGTFLSYGTGAGGLSAGFASASYTTAVTASTIAANTISDVTSSIAINDLSNPYALRVGAFTLTNSGTTTVNGSAASGTNSGLGGVILNSTATASTITGGTLAFGSSEGMIFAASSGAGNGTIASKISGSAGITKFGTGTLVLSSTTSDFTGGIRINQGTLSIGANTNLGDTGNGITFNGNATLQNTATVDAGSRPIILNNGAIGTIRPTANSRNFTTSGAVTGNGGLTVSGPSGNGTTFSLLAAGDGITTGNTFTGPITVGDGTNTGINLVMNSLADSANPIYLNTAPETMNGFTYGSGATTNLTLNNRQFLLTSAANVITNSSVRTLTINTDIGFSGTGARSLGLSGTGNFNGRLTDNAGGALSLSAGNWNLSGTNTYSGTTAISTGATLTIQGLQALSPNTSQIEINHGSSIKLLGDGTGTINYPNTAIYANGFNAGTSHTIFVGNNTPANGGNNPSSLGANGTIAFNNLTFLQKSDSHDLSINATGANGFRLQFNNVTLPVTGYSEFANITFNPTTAPITLAGTIIQTSGNPSTVGAKTLVLGGTATNNLVTGTIMDALDYTNLSNANAKPLALTKSSTSVWTLSGANTYTGVTTVSGGVLNVSALANGGNSSNLGASTSAAGNLVLNGGTLRYTGAAASTDRLFSLRTSSTIDASGTGAVNFTNTGAMGFNANTAAKTLTLTGSNTGDNSIAAVIGDNTAATAITKTGIGTWVLSGTNINTGATGLSGGGSLILDYTSNDTNKIAGILTLGGGTLTLKGATGTHAEVVTSTTLNAGGNFLTRDGANTTKLRMNAITRAAGGTISFGDATIADTDTNNVNGILGGWATLGNDWAVSANSGAADTAVTALGSYTTWVNSTGSATANYLLNGNGSIVTTAVAANTVKISNSSNSETLALNNLNLAITSTSATSLGGIMYTGGSDGLYSITGGTGRIVSSSANQELIFAVQTGTLSVDAFVGASSSSGIVTKSGNGTLAIGSANNYTGATRVNQGALRLRHATAAGTTAGGITVQNGAALELANSVAIGAEALTITGTGVSNAGALRNVASNTSSYAGAITLGAGGARINSDSSGTLTLTGGVVTSLFNNVTFGGAGTSTVSTAAISGAGGLVKDGLGTLTLSGTNTYTGATTIDAGKLLVHGSTAAESNFTVNSGATLGGSGTINGTVTLMSGAFLSPGASIESLGLGSSTWNGGSTVQVEFSTDGSTGVAGTEWDQINITGILDLSGASSSIPIILDLVSMLNATTAGALGSWNEDQNTTWAGFVTTTGGITGFAANKFTFDVADFQNTLNGTFNVSQVGNNLNLNYVIPEPKTVLLGVLGLLLLLRRRR